MPKKKKKSRKKTVKRIVKSNTVADNIHYIISRLLSGFTKEKQFESSSHEWKEMVISKSESINLARFLLSEDEGEITSAPNGMNFKMLRIGDSFWEDRQGYPISPIMVTDYGKFLGFHHSWLNSDGKIEYSIYSYPCDYKYLYFLQGLKYYMDMKLNKKIERLVSISIARS